MSQAPTGDDEGRDIFARAMAALRARWPIELTTGVVDFAAIRDADLEEILEIAQGLVAVVVLHVRYDAVYEAEGPPRPLTDLEGQVLSNASKLVCASVRASDLVVRTGPLDLAVVLVHAGPLAARAQAGRLRELTAEQRFERQGYQVRWRGTLGLATYQSTGHDPAPREILETLFTTAS